MMKYTIRILILLLVLITSSCSQTIDLDEASSSYYDLSSGNKITSFKFFDLDATIRDTVSTDNYPANVSGVIEMTMPVDTSVTSLIPRFYISKDASVNPKSGVAQNFSSPVFYNVMAQNGDRKVYAVKVNPYVEKYNQILSYKINGYPAYIDQIRRVITLILPITTNIEDFYSMVPEVEVSPGAGYIPYDQGGINLLNTVKYVVTSSLGVNKEYVVDVSTLATSDNSILSFIINGVSAFIDQTKRTVTANFPAGTDLSNVSSKIVVSGGAKLTNETDADVTNFSKPVVFTVTSTAGVPKYYTVNTIVGAAKSNECLVTYFAINSVVGIIDNDYNQITVVLPAGTDKTDLRPDIITSQNSTINPASGIANNFDSGALYTVTAEDGTTRDYVVNISYSAP